jgi:MFS family permease
MGLLFTLAGVGGVTGGLLVASVTRRLGQARTLVVGATALGVPTLLIPLAAPGWRLWLVGIALFLMAIGGIVYNVTSLSFRQAATPTSLLGRVNATARVVVAGTLPLGNLVGGALTVAIGARNTLWIAGVGAALSTAAVYLLPIGRIPQRQGAIRAHQPAHAAASDARPTRRLSRKNTINIRHTGSSMCLATVEILALLT